MECKKEINKANCKCSYPCSNRGMCCECVKSHRENNEIPGCFFPKEAEKTYDRSISYFISSMSK